MLHGPGMDLLEFKSYCITLPDSHAMRNRASEEFKRIGIAPRFFNGLNGQDFGLKTFLPEHHDWFSGPKIIGIYLSHWMLWRALELVEHDKFMVFEDDVFFHPSFDELWDRASWGLPADWQFVYIGACGIKTQRYQVVNPGVGIPRRPMATHAYMFKKEILQTMISSVSCVRKPLDLDMITALLPKIRYYAFIPSLASQVNNGCFTSKDWIF